MKDWNAAQYLKFEDERTRPSVDLLERVPLARAERCVDLGCGPGNSTELLIRRFPQGRVTGIDNSPGMLAKARERLPGVEFELQDISRWEPNETYDLIFANAVLQWIPEHPSLFARLAGLLKPGGCLAVQMPNNHDEPSHSLMRDVAADRRWAAKLGSAAAAKEQLGSFADYYRWLSDAGCKVDIWQTIYIHALAGPSAIVEWFKSTGPKPFLDPLSPNEQSGYLAEYQARTAEAYPAQADSKVLLRFPRLFFVACKHD